MGKLELQQMVLGPVYTNCYFLKNKETGEALIVDPKRIFQKVEDMGAKPVGILLTHGHFDHIMAVQAVKAEYQIPVYACRQEEEMLREPSVNMTDRMHKPCSVRPDVFLEDLQVFELFCGSVGRTDFPGGSSREIRESLHKLLNALPDETNVYPGHDTSTTIGYEKRYNPFV